MSKGLLITIDGVAGSGKSTTAKLVAEKLNLKYIDTGAMYRGVTLMVIEKKIDLFDEQSLKELVKNLKFDFKEQDNEYKLFLNERDVTREIRESRVTDKVSEVSMLSVIRKRLVEIQKQMGELGGVIMEGRDIGTVVFPDADLKIYMKAEPEVRALRRGKELAQKGISLEDGSLVEKMKRRDILDSTRDIAPLKCPEKAFIIDTTNLTITEQVDIVLSKVHSLVHKKNQM